MERYKIFDVGGKKYLFNGEAVKIVKVADDTESIYFSESNELKPLNSHRTNYLKTICLVLNNSCNLNCEYCFANKGKYDKPNEQMTFETAKKAVDMLAKNIVANNGTRATIAFFGGEPLLSFQLIKKVVDYTSSIDQIKFEYMITTNGTLINQEISEYLQTYNFDVMISIDGNMEQHDYYRKYKNGAGSYNDVVKAVRLFSNKKILNARITITENNTDILKCVRSILSLGIHRITFAADYAISDESYRLYIASLKKLILEYQEDIKNNILYDITNISSIIIPLVLNQRKLAFCNAGISYLTISADGKYYKCPRFVGEKSLSFGDENRDVEQKLAEFRKALMDSPTDRNSQCANCVYAYLCGGMCYHHAYSSKLTEFENVPRECIQRQILFEGTIQLLCRLSPKERRRLLLFYTKLWNTNKGGEMHE